MLVLLIAGMFMDAITIMFIALPIFLPVARELGWDLVWFGVVVMINLAIGLITPPIGINLFVAANITNLPLERIERGAMPFLIPSLVRPVEHTFALQSQMPICAHVLCLKTQTILSRRQN